MNTLMVSQTVFYIVSSIAIVALGAFLLIAIYQLIRILRNTREVSDDVTETYHKTKKKIKKVISSFNKRD